MSSYAVIRLKLWAEIDGIKFPDVVQYVSSWSLNDIPMASVLVAVGRNVKTQQAATIHSAISRLKVQVPAKVYMRAVVANTENAVPGVPNNQDVLIFEGKAVGTGWQRTESGAQFTIHMLHWMADLNYASALSASCHPGNPADWSFPSLFQAIPKPPELARDTEDATGDTPGEPAWVPMISKGWINDDALADIWGEVFWKWMQHVASDDPFEANLLGGQPGGGNQNTINALSRMGPNDDGAKLAITTEGADATIVAEGLRQALQNENATNWVNTTLWGKLIGEWAPAYWFSVVPRVTDALIVPFTGGLSGEPWAVIGPEDYGQAALNAQLQQVLRAVGIVHPVKWQTGADMNYGAVPLHRGGCCGWYQPETVTTGMVLIKDAPKWLCDPLLEYDFTLASQGLASESDVMGNAADEDGTGNERKPNRDLKQGQQGLRSIMDNYAHQWYALEALKGRLGEVAGKLRFDIAPGSNVLVVAAGDRHLKQDELREDIFATVVQVAYVINAEAQRAGTAFTLAHVRTREENGRPECTVPKPPLYEEAWHGAALLKEVEVEKV